MSADYEWHVERQKAVLAAHPEVKQYFRHYPLSIVPLVAVVLLQWTIAAHVASLPWWAIGLLAFFVGQFVGHSIATFIHEAAHNRVFKTNRGSMFVLWVIETGTLAFGKSLEYVAKHGPSHHRYVNDYLRDYEWWDRCQVAKLSSRPAWRLTESLLHLLPGGIIVADLLASALGCQDTNRKIERRDLSPWFKAFLMLTTLALYIFAWWAFGWGAALYFAWTASIMVGNWGISFKGQSIAEHDVRDAGKTFSRYGWINYLFFNTGYHDEHHTFPQVPWIYLPHLRRAAPEFFQNETGKSYLGWWWGWASSGFKPEKFNRYRADAVGEAAGE